MLVLVLVLVLLLSVKRGISVRLGRVPSVPNVACISMAVTACAWHGVRTKLAAPGCSSGFHIARATSLFL